VFGFSAPFCLDPTLLRTNPSLFAFFLGEECRFSASFQLGAHDFLLVVKIQQNKTTLHIIPITCHRFSTGRWYQIATQHGRKIATNNHDSALAPEEGLDIYVDGVSVLEENVHTRSGGSTVKMSWCPWLNMVVTCLAKLALFTCLIRKCALLQLKRCTFFEFGMLQKTINHQPSVAKRGSSSKNIFFTPQYLLNELLSDTQYMIWSPCYTYGNMVPEHAEDGMEVFQSFPFRLGPKQGCKIQFSVSAEFKFCYHCFKRLYQ